MTDERDPPSGTEKTIAAPDTNPASAATVAAPSSNVANVETVAENTLAPSSDVVRRAAGATPSSKPGSGLRSRSDSQARSVGEEMQAATIQRFGKVDRDRFELLDELARGGLGRVFRARDPRTNRIVAIKEVLQPSPDIITRFAREALVTANLQHPAIVPVYEVGRWDTGEPFYAMKLVQGTTLDALIGESKTLDARMGLVPHLIVVADALAYAHSERVIHRDLKPANILVGAYGETVVIDWGLAKNMATGEELDSLPHASTIPPDNDGETMIGAVLGTPAYMPPEQAIGEKVDEHADVYAIGAILYHVLAGVRPYRQARTMEELIHQVATEAPQPVRELAPDAPPELIAIVEKAMARRPADRYATAEGLAHDLRAFQAGKLVAAHRYTTRQLISRWIARHKGMVLTAVVALGVLITIAAIGVWRITKERDVAQAEREEARTQRAEAQTQRALAEERFATSLEELARQSLVAKAPDKALPLLVGSLSARDGKTTPTFDVLAGVARAAYGGLVGIAPPHASTTSSAGLASGRTWVISAASGEGIARAWDLRSNREVWTSPGTELLAVSPDGTVVLGSAPTGELKVLDAATGKALHTWKASGATPARTHVLAWAPDGSRFAAVAKNGAVFLGGPTSSTLGTLDPHTGVVWTAAFSPDSKLLATAGGDGTTMIRDAATGATLARLTDGPSEISSLAWVDAGRLVSGDSKGIVRLWSVGERRVVRRYKQPADVYGVLVGGVAPQRWVAAYGHGEVATVWDVETGTVRATLGGHTFGSDVAAAAAGLLVTTDETGNTYVWDPLTGERVQTLPNEGTVFGITTAGDRIVVYGGRRIRVWQLARDRILRAVPGHTARIRDLAWSADGATLFTASADGSARAYNLASRATTVLGSAVFSEPPITDLNTAPPAVPSPQGLRSLRLSPDGKVLATAVEDGQVILWELATKRPIVLTGHTGRVRKVVFSRDQRELFSVGDTTLRVWDLATGKQRAFVDIGGPGWDLALATDDVVVTHNEAKPNELALWRTKDLTAVKPTKARTRLYDLTTEAGHYLAGTDTEVQVFDATGRAVASTPFSSSSGSSVAAGKLALTGSTADIGLYDYPSLKPIRSWNTGAFQTNVRLRHDARLLASIATRTVYLWDAEASRLLAELELPVLLTQLAWSPDGTKLALAGASGTAWIWDLIPKNPGELAAYVKCVAPWELQGTHLVALPFDPAGCAVLAH